VDLREGTGKLICLKLLLKEDKRRAVANFFIPIAVRLDAMMALVIPSVRRLALGDWDFPVAAPLPFELHCHFSLSDENSRRFWSGLIDLTIHR